MRNDFIGLVGNWVLASAMATVGCNATSSPASRDNGPGDGGSSNGGSSGSGGSPGSSGNSYGGGMSQEPACSNVSNVAPCGGNLLGTWSVTASCLKVAGQLDLSLLGMACSSTPVTGFLKVAGAWTANVDGTFSDNTTTTGNEQFPLETSCLVISSTPTTCAGASSVLTALGYSSVICTSAASGGCDCSANVQQNSGIGLVSYSASAIGRYTTAGNELTTDGPLTYSYCVDGNTLTMTPKSTSPTLTGAIVFQKSGATGTGGATGAGGQLGAGGATSSGGKGGAGGTVAAGGAVTSGGKSNAGGAIATGGTNTAGGTVSTGGANSAGGSIASGGATAAGGGGTITGPCDIYGAANNPCVAAHSMVRALYGSYHGKLYQVRRADNTTKDIPTLSAGGIADTTPQDAFCAGSTCVVTVVYDQSGRGNDLWYQGSTQVPASTSSSPAKATTESLNVSGHKVYSLYINPGNCYWHDGSKSGMATGSQPEGMYMVTSGKHANGGCCFDYGNSETTRSADGAGSMDAINFSTTTAWGSGAGSGPWIMADLEYGLFAQNSYDKNQNAPTQTASYVTAVLKNNGTTEFALRGADATTGKLSTYYKGALPGGWSPMKKQGALILGCGGDCCKPGGGANASAGTFYEGAIVTGYPTDATEDAIQASIVAAGYGK